MSGEPSEPIDPSAHDYFEERVSHLLEEARMILPGVQTLFGFQLIAVFNQRFPEVLTPAMQRLYLGGLVLTALAVALVMTPAAYHRLLMPGRATPRFLEICSRLLLFSMVPLAGSMSIDIYLIARIVLGSHEEALALALGMMLVATLFWLVLPWRWRTLR